MFRRISCFVLLLLRIGALFCGPALAANHSLTMGREGSHSAFGGGEGGGGVGGAMGYLSVALVVLIALLGFMNASKKFMKKVKPKTRKWLRRVHGFLGVAVLVTIIIHILTVDVELVGSRVQSRRYEYQP